MDYGAPNLSQPTSLLVSSFSLIAITISFFLSFCFVA